MPRFYTVEVEADEMAKQIAKVICRNQFWATLDSDGDVDWDRSKADLQKLIEKELLK